MKLEIPIPLKLAALVVGTTGLYTFIGQQVPQKEVQPPVDAVLTQEMTPQELAEVGREIAAGKGICLTCHTIGQGGAGLRFPDLDGIAQRAETRIAGLSAVEYLAQSLYEPDIYVVEGFSPGMPIINKPPIGLSDQEIVAVIAFLQSLGGTPTVTLDTQLGYSAGR